ncbi:UNVERIFIED_CONTAM: hypothetical protein HDU68_010251 [Siphonaria sp. JEL0065]|nr:hypothetical protein HDU68_010251 [Siphonaria sp. JEL0065]
MNASLRTLPSSSSLASTKSSLRSVRSAAPGTPFATVKRATDTAVNRIQYTLGILDSLIVYRTVSICAMILLAIQFIYALATFKVSPLQSGEAVASFIAKNATTFWTLLFVLVAVTYFKLSHLHLLYFEKNLELKGLVGTSGLDEQINNRRWFQDWADGDPDYSELTIELRSAERALGLSIASQFNAKNDLFTAAELQGSNNPNEKSLSSPPPYSFPKHSSLYEMNVLRMPLATTRALKSRLAQPAPAQGAPPIVDSLSKEPVWCAADAGGTMIATREPELNTDDMLYLRNLLLQRKKDASKSLSPTFSSPSADNISFQAKLQQSVLGVSPHGVEIVRASDFDPRELKALGLL